MTIKKTSYFNQHNYYIAMLQNTSDFDLGFSYGSVYYFFIVHLLLTLA